MSQEQYQTGAPTYGGTDYQRSYTTHTYTANTSQPEQYNRAYTSPVRADTYNVTTTNADPVQNYSYTYETKTTYGSEHPVQTSYVSTTGGAGGATGGYISTSGVGANSYLAALGGSVNAYDTTATSQKPATHTSTYISAEPVLSTSQTGGTPAGGYLTTQQTVTYSVVRETTTPHTVKSQYLATPVQRTEEVAHKATPLVQSNIRISQIPRQNLLTPYRATMYPEFDLVEDIPDRRFLVHSVNHLLQKSGEKESLLVSPTKVSIHRQSHLSPAKIEFECLHKVKEQDGSIYEGQAREGIRHGKGKLTFKDGRVFQGEFEHGRIVGTGTLRHKSGKVLYEGGFNDTRYEGQGVLYCEAPIPLGGDFDHTNFDNLKSHWTKYEGEFKDGKKHGNGTLYLSNGDKFIGEWRDDKINGRGAYERVGGNRVQGRWRDNRFEEAH